MDSTVQISVDALKLARDAYHRERVATQPLEKSIFTDQHRLALEVSGFPRLILPLDRDLILGRSDNHSDYRPDIDMGPYGGHRMGVSRRHGVLRRVANEVYIADLDSRNGTMINEHRLPPHTLHMLRSEDILALGTLRLRIYFVTVDELG
jgi:pSer/pThr/pTyr-binding forkhead associated (FHA) protein